MDAKSINNINRRVFIRPTGTLAAGGGLMAMVPPGVRAGAWAAGPMRRKKKEVRIGGPKKDMNVLMTLNNNGQAITLSNQLKDKAATDGANLAKLIAKKERQYIFAQTFPTGTHAMWGPAATISEILEVELQRPRERLALAHDPRFSEYRAAVMEFLYRKQLKKAA